jgi:hypothetical protein
VVVVGATLLMQPKMAGLEAAEVLAALVALERRVKVIMAGLPHLPLTKIIGALVAEAQDK